MACVMKLDDAPGRAGQGAGQCTGERYYYSVVKLAAKNLEQQHNSKNSGFSAGKCTILPFIQNNSNMG